MKRFKKEATEALNGLLDWREKEKNREVFAILSEDYGEQRKSTLVNSSNTEDLCSAIVGAMIENPIVYNAVMYASYCCREVMMEGGRA